MGVSLEWRSLGGALSFTEYPSSWAAGCTPYSVVKIHQSLRGLMIHQLRLSSTSLIHSSPSAVNRTFSQMLDDAAQKTKNPNTRPGNVYQKIAHYWRNRPSIQPRLPKAHEDAPGWPDLDILDAFQQIRESRFLSHEESFLGFQRHYHISLSSLLRISSEPFLPQVNNK